MSPLEHHASDAVLLFWGGFALAAFIVGCAIDWYERKHPEPDEHEEGGV